MSITISITIPKKIVLFILMLSLVACYQQERNCKDFKTGKFASETTIEGKKFTTEFERNSDRQIETYEGKIDTFKVRWINDCEYIMQNANPKNRDEKKAISVRILNTNGKGYTFEYSYVGDAKKQKGTVTKLD